VIVVDSSVWINHLNNQVTPEVRHLRALIGREAALVERALRRFDLAPMLDPDLAPRAAANYRLLRSHGVTTRKTADLVIGTFCIERGHALLQNDRDFLPMQIHLGLRVVNVGEP
jgi:predicted nucleic acid-binding protein